MGSKPGNRAKLCHELYSKKELDTMIQTFNNLPQLVFSFLFIAFPCSNRLKVETILKDLFNFVPIKVNEGEYSSTDLNGSVKYGHRKKSV